MENEYRMSVRKVVSARADPERRGGLSAAERAALPGNLGGGIRMTDADPGRLP